MLKQDHSIGRGEAVKAGQPLDKVHHLGRRAVRQLANVGEGIAHRGSARIIAEILL